MKSIMFKAPMVRAILDGRKTQTRRIVKPQPPEWAIEVFDWRRPEIAESMKASEGCYYNDMDGLYFLCKCPYGKPGDRLWVREAWGVAAIYDKTKPSDICQDIRRDPNWPLNKAPCGVRYPANMDCVGVRIRPSIHMPRWASRITIEVTDVRVERLNDISEEDAIAEGTPRNIGTLSEYYTTRARFAALWESINGEGSWAANPWVWAIGFKKIDFDGKICRIEGGK